MARADAPGVGLGLRRRGAGEQRGQKKILHNDVLQHAPAKYDRIVIRQLESIARYPPADRMPTYSEMVMIRRFGALFDGNWHGKPEPGPCFSLPDLGPDYAAEEAENVGPATPCKG